MLSIKIEQTKTIKSFQTKINEQISSCKLAQCSSM